MKIINIDVIKQTYDVSPVEGDVNVIKVKFINTPPEWENNGYGVYALFTKDNDSEIMPVDKNTWECAIPNRMVAVNSGVKVILYAMNSDTTNPKRWVIDPVWVAISEGLDNSYDVTATSGLNKDNMDAISTLVQVISSYVDAEAERVEAEEKRAEAEIKRQGMVKDLGSFENADAYNEAIDNAKESGLYKAQYTEDGKVIPGLFLVIAGVIHDGKELVYQMQLRGSYLDRNKTCIPLMRVYSDGAWSDSIYQFESSYYKNSNIIDNANSEEMYPTNKGVSDYVLYKISKLIDGAPDALNTLGRLADAIGNFENAINGHVDNDKNPHRVTKNQLGLGNVDNTSDEDKILSKAARDALGTKLDKSIFEEFVANGGGVIDLGTYKIEVDPNTGNLIVNEEPQYREAIDKTLKTGVYKITLIEAGIERPSILIVLGSVDFNGKELITQYSFSDNPFSSADYLDLPLPKIRKYYYSTIDNKYTWTDGAYFNSEPIFQTTIHMEHNENSFDFRSETDYPSVAAVVRYVDKKLQPQAPVTTVPDVLKPNTEYNFGLQSTLNLSFPIDTEDGDVICIRFISTETPTNLVIDMSNVIDFELIPEKNTWYEICAKYDSQLMLWVLAYSEYMYMGG